MATQFNLVTNGLGGVGSSYASIQDLENLVLPNFGDPAYIDSMGITAPFNVNGLTLSVTVTVDGITQPQYTQTFTSNYATLDLLVAAIQIPDVMAVNNAGRLRLRTVKLGISQNLVIDHTGTANSSLGFNIFQDQVASGRSSVTSEISEDEMTYALVSASSMADGYLSRRYGLPLKSWSYDLIQAVCDIAGYLLIKRNGFNPEVYDANWVSKYNAALRWLDDVGNRRIHPVLVDAGHPLVPYAGDTNVLDDPRSWGLVMGSRPWGAGTYRSFR